VALVSARVYLLDHLACGRVLVLTMGKMPIRAIPIPVPLKALPAPGGYMHLL